MDVAKGSDDPLYRIWPRYRPRPVELGSADRTRLTILATSVATITAVLCVPSVTRATGLAPHALVPLVAACLAVMVLDHAILRPWATTCERCFDARLVLVPLCNLVAGASFVVVPNDPRSPLWMALLVYACSTASWQEIDASIAFLVAHAIFPLLTIPIFLVRGADPGWSVAGPVLCGAASGLAYHVLTMNGAAWRRARARQHAVAEQLRSRAATLERERIARELHDSVGAALGLAVLYGDLVERCSDDPSSLVRIARELRESARDGLGDMRGVLDALDPEGATASALAESLCRIARRYSVHESFEVTVRVVGDDVVVAGPPRLAFVRTFQEAVHNAVRHGGATHLDALLSVDATSMTIRVTDDGHGFDASVVIPGRGLAAMRARAEELSGTFCVDSRPTEGTTIELRLPRATMREVAA